jgi:D-alanyl-D-alanine carboxypeptidase/D-alanyl-D-alanine-endopeptidase (penicillin-binding protein 4)
VRIRLQSCVGRIFRRVSWVCLLSSFQAASADLPEDIARVVAALGVPTENLSIVVQDVESDAPVLSHLPDIPRNPASVMKLVTTWSALDMLGPAYTWPTEVQFLGSFDGTTLAGDLGFKGYGDPFFVLEEFWKLLRALRRTGLTNVEGDLVLDDSYFDVREDDPGAFDGQPFRAYNVVPNALLVNLKAVQFQFRPNASGKRVDIVTDPVLPNLEIVNHIDLIGGPCRGYQRGISFNVPDPVQADRVVFEGAFSQNCTVYGMTRTVLQHDDYTLGVFDALWRELGGRFRGSVRRADLADNGSPEIIWESRPLAEILRSVNKNSNNVMTRQLLYTIGASVYGEPATREKGIQAIMEHLAEQGIDVEPLHLVNGAGLSREGRVSAHLLIDLLRLAYRGPYAAEFLSSLSIGGVDGTTRGRFDAYSGNGRLHVKSGRVDHVSALAGFAHAPTGHTYAFAILINDEDAHRGPGQEIEESVLRWIFTGQ